jgi:hypothetical protein
MGKTKHSASTVEMDKLRYSKDDSEHGGQSPHSESS